MDNSEKELFESVGSISLHELYILYGKDLMPADIVLKFAEHKNFNAARAAFQKWDEQSVVHMGNYLSQTFRHEIELYATKDKYIAVSFLKHLVNEWDKDRREEKSKELNDPMQQEKAAELMNLRLSGKLPHIDIAGTDFTIDWRLRQMRETDVPWRNISFDFLREDESGEAYLGLYNTNTHELYMPPDDIVELPENVVVIEIPNELRLDPVAVAREYGVDVADLINEYPITEKLFAKVNPISASGLPELIEFNLKKQQEDKEERPIKRGR
jgi:hypothetical protein